MTLPPPVGMYKVFTGWMVAASSDDGWTKQ